MKLKRPRNSQTAKQVIDLSMVKGGFVGALKSVNEAARAKDWKTHANIDAADERVLWTINDGVIALYYRTPFQVPPDLIGNG